MVFGLVMFVLRPPTKVFAQKSVIREDAIVRYFLELGVIIGERAD